jgi:hypothetical protein
MEVFFLGPQTWLAEDLVERSEFATVKEGIAMGKTAKGLEAVITHDLRPERTTCLHCNGFMRADYINERTVATLDGVVRLHLGIRRCRNKLCAAVRRPYRPEAEGRFALPRHEFGLDVIALIGRLRYTEHRSIPEIHAHLIGRGVRISERTVENLLDRYDELLAVSLTDDRRLKKVLKEQKRVILVIDGLQPDVGHEVLWVVRDCLSGEILLAKSLLSACREDLAELLKSVKSSCPVPIEGISIRFARRWRWYSRRCRTSCASFTTCGRRRGRFTSPLVTPRRS